MLVLKYGGTSIGKPERMKKVASWVKNIPGKKIVVLSALSGTTNKLVRIGDDLLNGRQTSALESIGLLEKHYTSFVERLYTLPTYRAIGKEIISRYFCLFRLLAAGVFNDRSRRELLAQGELISSELFHHHLQEQKIHSSLLPALHFMTINEHQEPELEQISERLKPILDSLTDVDLIVTQGYICRNHRNEIDNLRRGGSDYTASLIGAAIKAKEIQIWTDIDGMHNNDPRIVKKTAPVSQLTFSEASELAYFGAKVLHPSTIMPARKYKVPVRLKNTMDEKAPGTIISDKGTAQTIKAVAAKDGITAINIKSFRMLMAYGFLRKVFEVFEKHRTSIDMITTSEVAVTVTIDDVSSLSLIREELQELGEISVESDQSIICIVGNKLARKPGVLEEVFSSLGDLAIRMVSFGGSQNNISLLVDTVNKQTALQLLNEGLFGLK